MGRKRSRKIPAKPPPTFPPENEIKKITNELLQERREQPLKTTFGKQLLVVCFPQVMCTTHCSRGASFHQMHENSVGRRALLEVPALCESKIDTISADASESSLPEFQLTCEQA